METTIIIHEVNIKKSMEIECTSFTLFEKENHCILEGIFSKTDS